jgi:hypothetical protein
MSGGSYLGWPSTGKKKNGQLIHTRSSGLDVHVLSLAPVVSRKMGSGSPLPGRRYPQHPRVACCNQDNEQKSNRANKHKHWEKQELVKMHFCYKPELTNNQQLDNHCGILISHKNKDNLFLS